MEPKNCWFVDVSPFPRVVWAFSASMFMGLLKRLWKFNKLYYHLTNQTCPKDHLTLHWKGLNLHSRGWVLQIASFEGSGSLGWKITPPQHLMGFEKPCLGCLKTMQRKLCNGHMSHTTLLITHPSLAASRIETRKNFMPFTKTPWFWGSDWLVFQEFQGIYCLKMSDDIYQIVRNVCSIYWIHFTACIMYVCM